MFQCVVSRGWKARCYLVTLEKHKREDWSIVTAARNRDSEGTASLRRDFLPWGSQVSAQFTSKSLSRFSICDVVKYIFSSVSVTAILCCWMKFCQHRLSICQLYHAVCVCWGLFLNPCFVWVKASWSWIYASAGVASTTVWQHLSSLKVVQIEHSFWMFSLLYQKYIIF